MARNNIDNNIFLFSICVSIIIFILSLIWWLKNKNKNTKDFKPPIYS